ncbi:MAG: hypothetical protein PHU44_17595 [Syntrophales bacterium]|nr:hypothetical protein [Syntrophales bacterium]MDD5640018.1 hypothetical protein [Syntrophales bacterium]
MATRIYFPSNIPAFCSPAFHAEWDLTGQAQRKECWPQKQNSGFVNNGPWSYTTGSPKDGLAYQFISPPLLAQTITGTVKGQFRTSEFASDDICGAVVIKVVSADGTVLRGVLLAHFPNSLVSPYSGSFVNRSFPPLSALTDVACQEGDRLVFELGSRSFAASGSYNNGKIEIGDNSANDLPEDETATNQYCPWIEFSADLQWQGFAQGDALGSMAAYESSPGVRADALGVLAAYSLIPDVGWVQANAAGVLVAYGVNPPTVTRRVFPVPNRIMRYQTQWGKRTFPVSYWE